MMLILPQGCDCHFCTEKPIQVLLPGGYGLCFKCYATLSENIPLEVQGRIRIDPSEPVIRINASLEVLKVRICRILKRDNFTITQIADKLGITRSTVYTLLKRKIS